MIPLRLPWLSSNISCTFNRVIISNKTHSRYTSCIDLSCSFFCQTIRSLIKWNSLMSWNSRKYNVDIHVWQYCASLVKSSRQHVAVYSLCTMISIADEQSHKMCKFSVCFLYWLDSKYLTASSNPRSIPSTSQVRAATFSQQLYFQNICHHHQQAEPAQQHMLHIQQQLHTLIHQ